MGEPEGEGRVGPRLTFGRLLRRLLRNGLLCTGGLGVRMRVAKNSEPGMAESRVNPKGCAQDARNNLVLTSLVLALCFSFSESAWAHGVNTTDSSIAEWFTRIPLTPNSGLLAVSASQGSEYVWVDAPLDHIASAQATGDIAFKVLRVSSDQTGMGFLVQLAAFPILGSRAAQLQIAIDQDGVADSGARDFVGGAETRVAAEAAWEHLIQTHFGSGGAPVLYDSSATIVRQALPYQIVDSNGQAFVELAVSWTDLGLLGPPADPLRLTLAMFQSEVDDSPSDIAGNPDAVDLLSDYGEPKSSRNTASEFVGDDVVDYFVRLDFAPSGELVSPLVIFAFRSNVGAAQSEWIALRNNSLQAASLDGYKLGDEEDPRQSEGMLGFPSGLTIAPNDYFVVAVEGLFFANEYGFAPDAEMRGGSGAPVLTLFPSWGGSTINLGNVGDQLLLLNGSNTIVDVVTYGTGADSIYDGVVTGPSVAFGQIANRDTTGSDTDDCSVDFRVSTSTCSGPADCGGCDSCVVGVCVPNPGGNGSPCDDGDPCTYADICGNATCVGTPIVCADDLCVDRQCDGTATCLETFLPTTTSCGTQNCSGDYCANNVWYNTDETCELFCDGAGSCAATCACGTVDTACGGGGCCDVSCSATVGCITLPSAQCTAGTDACGANVLTLPSACTGCGPANQTVASCGAGGDFVCNDTQHTPCETQNCNGTLMTCTNTGGTWKWRATSDCDDGELCTYGDRCDAGTCAGTPLVCESDDCTRRTCDGTTACVVELLPSTTPCGEAMTCPDDQCVGPHWIDYPESCVTFCDGFGACAGTCSCDPVDMDCSTAGCCMSYCDDQTGCLTLPGICPGTDACSPELLTINSECEGCSPQSAGVCSTSPRSYPCDSTQGFTQRSCGGDVFYCTNFDGAWAWRFDESCDDANPCTIDDRVQSGICEGFPVGDGASCSTPCIPDGTCQGKLCTGTDSCGTPDAVESEDLSTGDAESDLEGGSVPAKEQVRICGCTLRSGARGPRSPALVLLVSVLVLISVRKRRNPRR